MFVWSKHLHACMCRSLLPVIVILTCTCTVVTQRILMVTQIWVTTRMRVGYNLGYNPGYGLQVTGYRLRDLPLR